MKNEHLIPINVIDIVEKLKTATNENERNNYILRLETIRDYCDTAAKKAVTMTVPVKKKKHFKMKIALITDKNCKNGPWNKGKVGLYHSKETKEKMSKSASKKPKEVVKCPTCGKFGGKPAMIRFHFDNCKG